MSEVGTILGEALGVNIDDLARYWARFPTIWEPKVSPDGLWVAWTWIGVDEIGDVWIAPTDGSQRPRRLTDESEHTFVRAFSKDGRQMLLAQSEGASEHDHLILLDRETGNSRLVTQPQDDHYVFGGTFTPDRERILYTASFDDVKGAAIQGQRIYLHDLASGKRKAVSAAECLDSRPLELSEDGRYVLYHRQDRHPGGSQIWLLDLATLEDREILNVGDSLKAYGKWLGSGLIVVHAETEMNDRVGILEQTTGAVRWLIDDQGRSIEYVIPSHDGRTFAIIDFKRGQLHASEFDVETRTERPIAVAGSSLLPVDCLPSGCWICELYCSTAPHELVEFIPEPAETRTLTHARDHLPSAEMPYAQAKPWNWKSSDGMEIDGWLYEPKGPSRGLIVDIHGGPTWHREDWIETEIQFLVAAGFSVLDPNYRGSTGYGRPFREAIKQDGWGGREQADIRTGIESLITADKAKRGRIGVVGLSYGGYSSWYQLVKAPDLIAAAAPICGMYHLTIDYDETGMPHGRAYSEEMMGGPPEEEPQRYFEASPANFIDQIKGRLLIVHGLRDSNVSPENSFAASRDLTRANVAYELLTFPNEGHGIHRASNRDALFRKLADFFGKAFA